MKLLLFIYAIWSTIGCSVTNIPKKRFADSEYKTGNNQRVYVSEDSVDTLKVYLLSKVKDTIFKPSLYIAYPAAINNLSIAPEVYYKSGLNIGAMTVPLKYRLSQNAIPGQLNVNLNGAIFLGYRKEFFKVRYLDNTKSTFRRVIRNYGVAIGGFGGISGSSVKPSVTNNAVSLEYDGVTLNKGFALLGNVNKVSAGFAIGFDNLLDGNRKYWIYQNKPWLGLVFGYRLK